MGCVGSKEDIKNTNKPQEINNNNKEKENENVNITKTSNSSSSPPVSSSIPKTSSSSLSSNNNKENNKIEINSQLQSTNTTNITTTNTIPLITPTPTNPLPTNTADSPPDITITNTVNTPSTTIINSIENNPDIIPSTSIDITTIENQSNSIIERNENEVIEVIVENTNEITLQLESEQIINQTQLEVRAEEEKVADSITTNELEPVAIMNEPEVAIMNQLVSIVAVHERNSGPEIIIDESAGIVNEPMVEVVVNNSETMVVNEPDSTINNNNNNNNNISSMSNIKLKNITNILHLKKNYYNISVILSSSNSYSHGKVNMLLGDYLNLIENQFNNNKENEIQVKKELKEGEIHEEEIINTNNNKNNIIQQNKSNETYYLFGNNDNIAFKYFESLYEIPPCDNCREAGAVTIGIGGQYSGVSFHYHGPGFSEVIHGSKKFFLFPPDVPLHSYQFHPNMTMQQWYEDVYPLIMDHPDLYECEIFPGDILYFPARWYHGTLNMQGYNFFVSLFLDPQLMKNKNDIT